jgi:hypothetical protein
MTCKKIKHGQIYFEGQILHFLHQVPPDLLLDGSAGRIARELLCMNQEISPVSIIPPWFSMLSIAWGMNNILADGCRSET